jgi:putative MFS transporter
MLSPEHRRLLVLLGGATLFDGYDRSIATLALPYIGRDLGADETTLGFALSIIRLGALGAAFCGMLADRVGRRRVLLFTVVGYTVATVATGLSLGIADFVIYQLVATLFLTAEVVLANVVVAEELPPERRASGIGLIGALGALGSSLAAILFPFVHPTSWGWRGLYLIGALPLVAIATARRSLPETSRWQRIDATRAGRVSDLLAPGLRSRFVRVALALFLAMMTESPGYSFASYHATHVHGWTPAGVSALLVTASAAGFLGWIVGGRFSDRFGRRSIAALGLIAGGVAQALFYTTSALLPAIAAMILGNATGMAVIYTYATELFPTRLRGTARAWIGYLGVVGATAGLAAVGAVTPLAGGSAPVLTVLAFGNLAAAAVLASLPETRARDLDEIAAAATPPEAQARDAAAS